jgi:hypothetical protein
MKNKYLKLTLLFILVSITSCNEPETVLTNIIHPDGSVTRKIEMKSVEDKAENRFKLSDIQVPFDSTWAVKDSCEVNKKGDTTWVKRGVKRYKNVGEINNEYIADNGANKEFSREADFIKKFRWFNTVYRFSEKIDKIMQNGYPVNNYLDQEELKYFYSPETINSERLEGPDSLKYKTLNDSVKNKTDRWALNSMVSEWIGEFSRLTAGKEEGNFMKESLKSRENDLVNLIRVNEKNEKFDSLWSNGIILKDYLGETNYLKYKTEADTAAVKVLNQVINSFKGYSVRISMPGKVIGSNGFIDSSQVLLWQVKSDYFLTEPYEMWAESKIPNKWVWMVSGLFLAFVLTGVIMRVRKKG